MAEPTFFTKNYVSADDTITATSGSTGLPNLYDRDVLTLMKSVGSNDSTTETWDITFYEGTTAVNRTIDTLFILNHNIKQWNLDQYNSGSWLTVASKSADTGGNTMVRFPAFTDSRCRFQAVKTTPTANVEKQCGQLVLCAFTFAPNRGVRTWKEKWREESYQYSLADGTVQRVFTKRTAQRLGMFGAQFSFMALSQSERDQLFSIKETGTPFIVQPDLTKRPERIFYCHWDSSWEEEPTVIGNKDAGYNVSGSLVEV